MQVTRSPSGRILQELFVASEYAKAPATGSRGPEAIAREQIRQRMDARRNQLESQGHTLVRRYKVGRNDPCPCGSGLKFKRCHVDKTEDLNRLLATKAET